ncbi:MAG: hypothetical protein KF688_03010 [Pirellulales bacterium]|nr:hypothetical protein [Pirellulales bacterium]
MSTRLCVPVRWMRRRARSLSLVAAGVLGAAIPPAWATEPVVIQVDAAAAKPISPDLFGIFFEDINYAADGGLYAELVQNRSFEYRPTEQRGWNPLTSWELVQRGGGRGALHVDAGRPLHPNNPHYAVVDVQHVGGGVGVSNPGFDGIVVRKGAAYDLSLFVRQLYVERRWGGPPFGADDAFSLTAQLEDAAGAVLGQTTLSYSGTDWQRVAGEIVADADCDAARLVVLFSTQGGAAIDVVSLFPRETFRGRANGLRKDLAETIAALAPKFVRFPGGCLVHGNGLPNMYRWKDSIGPIHERREQPNLWGYHQTLGLGYFEYFQFCEDVGAKPLPVVPAGVSCQNSGYTAGRGQEGLPMAEMAAYLQEVLDLIEWANGPATSEWGAKRAAAGHPDPFGLEYLGVGNEEHITPAFEERFRAIEKVVREKHPEIVLIGTVGPTHSGRDYDEGWRIANALKLPMVDEHYYESPRWFVENLQRYDKYDRAKSAVYLGEYAAHDEGRRSTLRSALAEAAYLTHLERNGDVVRLASYAPLLAKEGRTQWRPDLIYFSNTSVRPTINFEVQKLFGVNAGDRWLATTVEGAESADVAVSSVQDSSTGAIVLKIVNRAVESRSLVVRGAALAAGRATCTVLAGSPDAVNGSDPAEDLKPTTTDIAVGPSFGYEAPASSLTVLRLE